MALKEVTGKTLGDLCKDYKELEKQIDLYHDELDAEISSGPGSHRYKYLAKIVVSLMREAEFGSKRYIDLFELFNALSEVRQNIKITK